MKSTLFSMTGFVSKTVNLPPSDSGVVAHLTFSIRSLNARFFEANCRIPQALISLEVEFSTRARALLKRGSLSISINVSDVNYFKGPVQASLSTIEHYLGALRSAKQKFSLPGEISVETLLQLPNIFVTDDVALAEQVKQKILIGFDQAIDELKNVRAIEGARLLEDINERITKLMKLMREIESAFAQAFEKRQKEVEEQLEKLQQSSGEVAQQQRMQLHLELDRIDVHEEITRFNTHIKSFRDTLDSEVEEKGRHLDFILQELGREINTMTAKCANSDMSSHAVAVKVELEKCREQVQNIV